MKKIVVFCIVFICLGLSDLSAQYDISLLHSATGKKWVQVQNPDNNQGAPADLDDSFIFYSNGKVVVDYGTIRSAADTKGFSGGNTTPQNNWTVNGIMIRWTVGTGETAKSYSAEIQVLTADKLVVTLQEPGSQETRTVVLVPNL